MSQKSHNGWQPFRKGHPKRYKTRAILAHLDGVPSTCTWQLKETGWICVSASPKLKWIQGMTDTKQAKAELDSRGYVWEWIEPMRVVR